MGEEVVPTSEELEEVDSAAGLLDVGVPTLVVCELLGWILESDCIVVVVDV